MTIVNTNKVRKFLIKNEKFMTKGEISYSLQILRQLNYKKQHTQTLEYFKWLRNRRLMHHKKVANFALRVFEKCGAEYKKFFQKYD